MARTSVYAKLLNSDGSLCRERVGSMETSTLIESGRVTVSKSKFSMTLRLKALPSESDSAETPCMPTVGEMLRYAESRKVPEELAAKIEACQPLFVCRVMDLTGATA